MTIGNGGGITKMAKFYEFQCSYCGMRVTRSITAGRPTPGTCPRKGKTRDGRTKPHSWVKSRSLG